MAIWEFNKITCEDEEITLIENLRKIDNLKSKDEQMVS